MWIPADKEFHIDEACELTTHIIWTIEYGPHNDEFRPT